jgi:hypothetical protein
MSPAEALQWLRSAQRFWGISRSPCHELLPKRARFQLRTVFLMAVIVVLFVDAFFSSGAYTQAAYAQLVAAADFSSP